MGSLIYRSIYGSIGSYVIMGNRGTIIGATGSLIGVLPVLLRHWTFHWGTISLIGLRSV